MLGHVISCYKKYFHYRVPLYNDPGLFSNQASKQNATCLLGLLKHAFCHDLSTNDCVEAMCLESMAEMIFRQPVAYVDIKPMPFLEAKKILSTESMFDGLALAVILALSTTDRLEIRLQALSDWLSHYSQGASLIKVVSALQNNQHYRLKKTRILGEGFQNIQSRLNGMSSYGWFEYRRQMACMVDHVPCKAFEKKYDFLLELPDHTLGGAYVAMMRNGQLAVTGRPGGMAAFFMWHDLTHLLSGNGTNFIGELGANAFTAGCSKQEKLSILAWGLLQFNLGHSLAVIATSATNQLNTKERWDQYLLSLHYGSESTLDVLQWSRDQLIEDLQLDLTLVREKYSIQSVE